MRPIQGQQPVASARYRYSWHSLRHSACKGTSHKAFRESIGLAMRRQDGNLGADRGIRWGPSLKQPTNLFPQCLNILRAISVKDDVCVLLPKVRNVPAGLLHLRWFVRHTV